MASEYVFHSEVERAVVNTEIDGFQGNPQIAAFSDGRYAIVWNDESGVGGDASVSAVKGRIYAADGTALTGEFLVNQTTAGAQSVSSITVVDGDNLVVSWTSRDVTDPTIADVQARIFSSAGIPTGNEFSISSATGSQQDAVVTRMADGGFLAVWTDFGPSGSTIDGDIRAQRYASDGTEIGEIFTVNTVTSGSQYLPDVAVLLDRRVVVTWTDNSGLAGAPNGFVDSSSSGIKAQILSDVGARIGNEFLVNQPTNGMQSNSTVAALSGGGFVVGWADFEGVQHARAQTFDASGAGRGTFMLGQSPIEAQGPPQIVAWKDGGFLAMYTMGQPGDTNTRDIGARYFADIGYGQPYELIVNAGRFGLQGEPEAAILPDGSFVFAWEHIDDNATSRGDGSGTSVMHWGMTLHADIHRDGLLIGTYANDYLLGREGVGRLLGYGGDDVLDGGAGDDEIVGGAGRDELFGRAGNDSLEDGGAVADTMIGGPGDDKYIVKVRDSSTLELSGEGNDTVWTTFAIYQLQANIENLVLTDDGVHGAGVGNALDNTIIGGTGRDDLFGRAGNDTLRGGYGDANTLLGDEGDDTYIVDAAGDSIYERPGEGTDTVQTTRASFILPTNVENLDYTGPANVAFIGIGNDRNNVLSGGQADDFLDGRGGDDILIGGKGLETLLGGAGADQFRFTASDAGPPDRILDFVSGEDKIMIESTGFAQTGVTDFQAGAAAAGAGSTFLYDPVTGIVAYDADGNGAGGTVVLARLNAGLSLTIGDFGFF